MEQKRDLWLLESLRPWMTLEDIWTAGYESAESEDSLIDRAIEFVLARDTANRKAANDWWNQWALSHGLDARDWHDEYSKRATESSAILEELTAIRMKAVGS